MGHKSTNTHIPPEENAKEASAASARIYTYLIDPGATIQQASANIGSVDSKSMIGQSFLSRVDEKFHAITKDRIHAHFVSGNAQAFDYTFTEPGGDKHYMSAVLVAVESAAKTPAAHIIARDETLKKHEHQALEQSEDRYRQMANLTFEGIVIYDRDTTIDCNEVLLQLTGYSREEIIGENIAKILGSSDLADRATSPLNEVSGSTEAKLLKKDGSKIAVEAQLRWVHFQGRKYRALACRDISIRKKAEGELRKLSTAVDRSYSSIVITNKKGCIEYVNPAFTATTGYTLEEAAGKNPSFLKTDYHNRKYYKELWCTILEGKVWEGEFLNRKKDGSEYWERAVISPVFNEKREITHFLAIKDDITDRRLATAALKQSEDRHRIVSDLISDYVYRFEMDGESDFALNWTSGAFEKITGYSEEEINQMQEKWLSIIHPSDREKILLQYADHLAESTALRTEYRILTKNGDVRWLSDYVQPIFDTEKDVRVILGAVQDITARKQAEQALRASEANMNLLLKVIPDHIFVFNRKGIFTNVFSNEKDPYFKTAEGYLGRHYDDYFPRDLTGLFKKHLERAFQTGELQTFEYRSREAKNTRSFEARLIISGSDQIIAVLRDITEKKIADSALRQAMESAERANRSKSAFLANMSHEIRTPINAVLGFADLLYDQVQEPLQRNYLKSIISSGTTLMTLLNDILDLSKIEAGKMGINPAKVDVAGILEEIRHIFALKASEKKIAYTIELGELEPCLYEVDELRLRQILLNLVDNAIKFTDRGMVKIAARSIDTKTHSHYKLTTLEIIVEDSGIGIPPEYQEKIFKSFVQKDQQDKRKYGGTGLGLAITKRLVQLMGGDIKLESSPGAGSIFRVAFPNIATYRLPSLILHSKEAEDTHFLHIEGKSIMIVEKDSMRKRELKSIFSGKNIDFVEIEAVEHIRNGHLPTTPDLIIASFNDGPEEMLAVREHLRTLPALSEVPIVLVQPYDEEHVAQLCPEDPLCIIIKKPVEASVFIKKVQDYLLPGIPAANSSSPQSGNRPVLHAENQALVQQLEEELMPRWELTASSASFTEIEMFAEEIGEIAERYDNNNLKVFSRQLMVHAHHFDIDNMHALLGGFPKLVDDLKKNKPA